MTPPWSDHVFAVQQQSGSLVLQTQWSLAAGQRLAIQWQSGKTPWQLQLGPISWHLESAKIGRGCLGVCPPVACCWQPLVSKAALSFQRSSLGSRHGKHQVAHWGLAWWMPPLQLSSWQLELAQGLTFPQPVHAWRQQEALQGWRWQSQMRWLRGKGRRGWALMLEVGPSQYRSRRYSQVPNEHPSQPSLSWQTGLAHRWFVAPHGQWGAQMQYHASSNRWQLQQHVTWHVTQQHHLAVKSAWHQGKHWRLRGQFSMVMYPRWQGQLAWVGTSGNPSTHAQIKGHGPHIDPLAAPQIQGRPVAYRIWHHQLQIGLLGRAIGPMTLRLYVRTRLPELLLSTPSQAPTLPWLQAWQVHVRWRKPHVQMTWQMNMQSHVPKHRLDISWIGSSIQMGCRWSGISFHRFSPTLPEQLGSHWQWYVRWRWSSMFNHVL